MKRIGGSEVIEGRDPDTNLAVPVGTEVDGQVTRVAMFVWNTATLEWERMKQPTVEVGGDLTVSMGDLEKLLAGDYWKDKRFSYDVNENFEYKGVNTTHGASQDATTWYIYKYHWDVDGNLEYIEGPLVGSWTGRAALGWA